MKEFKIKEKDFKMATDWSEITLDVYVKLAELQTTKEAFGLPELYLLRVLEILCNVESGDLDDLTIDMVNELSLLIDFISKEPVWSNVGQVNIEGIDYVFPQDLNHLTMGEYISIKTLQENNTQSGIIPWILAVILRPGSKIVDPETGKEKWIQEKFSTNNLEWRKELFLKQPVFNLIGPVSFFLSGSGTSTNNIKVSTQEA